MCGGVLYCRVENDRKDRPTNAAAGARSAGGGASVRISYGRIFSFPTGLSDKLINMLGCGQDLFVKKLKYVYEMFRRIIYIFKNELPASQARNAVKHTGRGTHHIMPQTAPP